MRNVPPALWALILMVFGLLWLTEWSNKRAWREREKVDRVYVDSVRRVEILHNKISERIVYRVEIPLGGTIRAYTATNLKLEGTSVSFRDSATGNAVTLQGAIVTRIRDSLMQEKR